MRNNNNAERTTKAIRNAGKALNMNIVAMDIINGKLKVWFFKIPHSPIVVQPIHKPKQVEIFSHYPNGYFMDFFICLNYNDLSC